MASLSLRNVYKVYDGNVVAVAADFQCGAGGKKYKI